MLQHCARSWHSLRSTSQLSKCFQRRSFTSTTAPNSGLLVSRLSNRTDLSARHAEPESQSPSEPEKLQLEESPLFSRLSDQTHPSAHHAEPEGQSAREAEELRLLGSRLLSRLGDKTHPRTRHAEPKSQYPRKLKERQLERSRFPVTSFISTRSAQQRDHAAKKWFTDVRKLDVDKMDQSDDIESRPSKKNTEDDLPMQHQLRPKTDLEALFVPPSAISVRIQTKKELGGDYAKYLPDRFVEPSRFPIDYARLTLGRNKHIPLIAHIDALNIITEAIQGRTTKQDCTM